MPEIYNLDKLIDVFLSLKSKEEYRLFLEDLCTIKELQEMAQRLETAVLLNNGESYLSIVDKVGTSTATISRVNRCLLYGPGGYKIALNRVNSNDN